MPLLSVVIVSWNRADELERCLRSVLEETRYEPLEVVVVDNGSTDGSRELAESFAPQVRLIANDENLGAPHARNQGMEVAQGDVIALVDSDAYVVDDVIGRAATTLLNRPDVAVLGSKLCFPDGRLQHSANRAMSIRLSLMQDLWLYRLMPRRKWGRTLLGGYYEEDEEVDADWLAGAFLVFRRSLFLENGGFNPRLFPEDSEWGIRLSRSGHRIVYAPQLGVVYHTGSQNLWPEQEKLRLYHEAGIEAYRVLNGRKLAQLYRLTQLFGSIVRWGVYELASKLRPRAYFSDQAAHYRLLVSIHARVAHQRGGT